MSDVLLIWPQALLGDIELEAAENRIMPLGLAYIASSLESAGYSVAVLDMVGERADIEEVIRVCEVQQPRLIGISCTSFSYGRAKALTSDLKNVVPDVPIIMGGPHVTFADQEALEEAAVDVIVRGEGDVTIVELARSLLEGHGELQEILGITFKSPDGTIIRMPDRRPLDNLNGRPHPARHLFPLDHYAAHSVLSSRGCPFKCNFCSAGAMAGGKYRLRSPEDVVNEVVSIRQRFSNDRFFFVDDAMTSKKSRMREICELLLSRCPGISWKCESRVDVADPSLFELIRTAGCMGVQFGVESGDANILRLLGKKITPNQVTQAVQIALEAGLEEVVCSFIIGHPFDDLATVNKTLDFANSLKAMGVWGGRSRVIIRLSVLVPFPGTEVHRRADELGLKILTNKWDSCAPDDIMIETQKLSRQMIRRLQFKSLTMLELGYQKETAL